MALPDHETNPGKVVDIVNYSHRWEDDMFQQEDNGNDECYVLEYKPGRQPTPMKGDDY